MSAWIRKHALAIALAFLAPALLWYWLERKEARVRVTLAADIPVVSLEPGLSEGITVTVGADTVSSVRALEISVANSGNVPIRQADFEAPVTIMLPSRVITRPVLTVRQPASLTPVLEVKDSAISVQPLLLNDGDTFTFRTLLADWNQSDIPIQVRGRISNVRDLEVSDQSRRPAATDENDSGGGWFVLAIIGLVLLVTSIAEITRRWKLPGRVRQIASAQRSLQLSEPQTGEARQLLESLQASCGDPAAVLGATRNRVEMHVRGVAVHAFGAPAFTEKSIGDLLEKLERRGVMDSDQRQRVHLFLRVAGDLLASGPRWRTDEDIAVASRFGVGLIVQLRQLPSLLSVDDRISLDVAE